VMDHGCLTDTNGRKTDFRHVILVMTTNAGAEILTRASMGFTEQDHSSDGLEIIRRKFTPEFRNRLDSIIQFKPLTPEAIDLIVEKFLTELQSRLDEKNVSLTVDDVARDWLASHGYDRQMGARPMARLVKDRLKKPLANEILFGRLAENGGRVSVMVEDNDLKVKIETLSKIKPELADKGLK
jgi:ATP-dependent Clp protease ATP-binding subunit ClpA